MECGGSTPLCPDRAACRTRTCPPPAGPSESHTPLAQVTLWLKSLPEMKQAILHGVTVGATVIALSPLALHGGPLWEPLCYAQIGGLTVATFVTLLLVPVIYAIFVLDLKWVKWEVLASRPPASSHM